MIKQTIKKLQGIGPVMVTKIYKKLVSSGAISADRSYTEDEIKSILKTYVWDDLPISAQADLTYNPDENIPRSTLEIMNAEFLRCIKGIKFEVAGSFRRLKDVCHDVDIVVSKGPYKRAEVGWEKILISLKGSRVVKFETPYAMGQGKLATFINIIDPSGKKWVAKVDIFITPPQEYIFMLLYATGSGLFNIRMRAVAKKRGYLLNQKGLFKRRGSHLVPVDGDLNTERKIFKYLDMTYKLPKDRVR